jgi:plastocyanin domain-containing protein
MDTAEILVTVAGIALIAIILWFFFGPKKATQARRTSDGSQEVRVEVRGAYAPDRVEVEVGQPIRMIFNRKEPNACTAQVVFPDFGIVKDLPVGRHVSIEITPQEPGEYQFHCGMNMVRGRLIVTPKNSPVPA